MEDNTINNQAQTKKKPTFLGKAVPTQKEGVFAVKKPAVIGETSFFLCPKCNAPCVVKTNAAGVFRMNCNKCGTIVLVKGAEQGEANTVLNTANDEKTEQTKSSATDAFATGGNKVEAKLVWGGLLSKKSYVLKIGENWIGRQDSSEVSDIMVKDDYMSRKSVCIDVSCQRGQFFFKLTVVNATNPVKVNGKTYQKGQSIYLNYEDYIFMGKTTFYVKKNDK